MTGTHGYCSTMGVIPYGHEFPFSGEGIPLTPKGKVNINVVLERGKQSLRAECLQEVGSVPEERWERTVRGRICSQAWPTGQTRMFPKVPKHIPKLS